MKQFRRRLVLFASIGVLFLSIAVNVITPFSTAQAAVQNPADIAEEKVKRWLFYRGMRGCLEANYFAFKQDISRADVTAGKLVDPGSKNQEGFGYLAPDLDGGSDGSVACTDGSIWVQGANAYGFDGVIGLICELNRQLNALGDTDAIQPNNASDCEKSTSWKTTTGTKYQTALTRALSTTGKRPAFDLTASEMYYIIGQRSLETFCGNTTLADGIDDLANDETAVIVDLVNTDTGARTTGQTFRLFGRKENDKVNDIYYTLGGNANEADDRTCAQIARITVSHSQNYSAYIINEYNNQVGEDLKDQFKLTDAIKKKLCGNPPPGSGTSVPSPAQKIYATCVSGIVQKFNAAVDKCKVDATLRVAVPVANRTDLFKVCLKKQLPSAYRASIDALGASAVVANDNGETTAENTTTCAIDGIGWIICPTMNFIAKLNDAAFGFLNNFLTIEPELLTDDAAQSAWQTFRDFANAAFVVAFLVIIYSQLTGAGITNYGLKKLLPKLVIAAVMVNISYYVCQIAVDISNILGSSVYDLFKNIPIGADGATPGAISGAWESLVGGILAVGAVIGVIAVVIFAPVTLLAVAAAVLVLIARKAFLIILVVISPLAFVAYLLPNTEQWFQKWWKAFSSLLALYVVVAAIFGGSVLASRILTQVAEQNSGGDDKQMLGVVALAVMGIPLFAVPTVLKGALSAAGSVGSKLASLQDTATGKAKQNIKEGRLGEAKAAYDARSQRRKVETRLGKGRMTRAGNFLATRKSSNLQALGGRLKKYDVAQVGAKFDETSTGQYLGADRGKAAATAEYHKAANEETERQQATMSEMRAEELLGVAADIKQSSERRAAALRQLTKVGGHQHIQSAYDYLMQQGDVNGKDIGDVQQLAASALLDRRPAGVGKSQANALVNGKLQSGKDTSGNLLQGYNASLRQRLRDEKFDERQLAGMDVDDLARFAQMKAADKLDATDVAMLDKLYKAAKKNPNLNLAGEQIHALEQAINGAVGSTPTKVDGTAYDDPKYGLTKLVQPNTK